MNRQLVLAALVSFIILPMCIFLHELGHFSVAKSYGWRTKLFPAHVLYYEEHVADFSRLLFLCAGPIVDILQIASGLALLIWLHDPNAKQRGVIYWIAAVLAFVSIKWLLTPILAFFVPLNDEAQISALLGWHPMVLPFLVMPAGIVVLIYLVRTHLRHGSVLQIALVPIFGFLGAGVWANWLGPMVL